MQERKTWRKEGEQERPCGIAGGCCGTHAGLFVCAACCTVMLCKGCAFQASNFGAPQAGMHAAGNTPGLPGRRCSTAAHLTCTAHQHRPAGTAEANNGRSIPAGSSLLRGTQHCPHRSPPARPPVCSATPPHPNPPTHPAQYLVCPVRQGAPLAKVHLNVKVAALLPGAVLVLQRPREAGRSAQGPCC
jgi:hypothetical protein